MNSQSLSTRKGIYQDKKGKIHIAHQPHGFANDQDQQSDDYSSENEKQQTDSVSGNNLYF